MKILNPLDTEHEIIFIPRVYVNNDVSLELTKEITKEVYTYTLTPITIDGYCYINFEQSFLNNDKFQMKVSYSNDVIYRDIVFVTDQSNDTQNYKTTKGIFTYE